MAEKTIINEIYTLLNSIGVVNTKAQFYKDWLNRSESYMRVAKYHNKLPSTHTLAVCSSKLKYYADLLKKKKDMLSKKFDDLIYTNSKGKWIEKIKFEKEQDDQISVLH